MNERIDELLGGLYPWQTEYLQCAMQVRYAGLSIPRGAGKSHMAAALALATLEQAEQPGEIAIVSATVAQARTAIFDPVEYWLRDRKSEFRRQVAGNNIAIERRDLPGCRIRLLGSNPRSAHGLIPHLIICDELAQWAPNTAARLVAALRTSLGKRPDAKMMALSTRGGTPEMCEFERWLRTCDYSMIYTADDGDQWNDPDTWYKCNPSLQYQPEMQAVYADEAKKAETDEGFKAAFIALRLNRGGADHQRTMLIDADRWRDVEADIAPIGRNVVWGLDIGSQASLTAAACYHADSDRDVVYLAAYEYGVIHGFRNAEAWNVGLRRGGLSGPQVIETINAAANPITLKRCLKLTLDTLKPHAVATGARLEIMQKRYEQGYVEAVTRMGAYYD